MEVMYEAKQENQKNYFVNYHYYHCFGYDYSDVCFCALFILAQEADFVNGCKRGVEGYYEKNMDDGFRSFCVGCFLCGAGAGQGGKN